jgi:predicted phage-related endonuclease
MAGKLTDDRMMSASRLPGLMGYSKYSRPNDELQYSINAIDGKPREDIGNEAMAWGNTLEPVVLTEACKRLGIAEFDVDIGKPFKTGLLALQCSLDGIAQGTGQTITSNSELGIYVVGQDSIVLDGPGVLEAKVTKVYPEDAPDLARGPIQLQGQLLVTGYKWGAVCVLYQGIEMRVFLFDRHAVTERAIVTAVNTFESKLVSYRQTCAIDWYAPQSSEDMDRIYPSVVEEAELALPEAAGNWVNRIMDAKASMKTAKEDIEQAEIALKKLLGQAKVGKVGNLLVEWPMRHYSAQAERLVPAKEAYSARQSTLKVKVIK